MQTNRPISVWLNSIPALFVLGVAESDLVLFCEENKNISILHIVPSIFSVVFPGVWAVEPDDDSELWLADNQGVLEVGAVSPKVLSLPVDELGFVDQLEGHKLGAKL